ncbi:RNA polymerase sigma-70 factor (ECF subfamily) [Filimonas zeae]|uniref:DNA-directed RNA polymerase sigma-70 factor n=1 Tax=Filimonas zeae TaxID=1737353 RepID=A0A917MZA4_9BACT|nr:sigma-70 family RNA polymerase sigma factor [Filimonas zeae]MDR6342991.1 RNA polymerase sigma-70 factor (ECF subfamily) [Filimonas zeae]GGH83515.1 DNA-directed RNA polymerase sigma-70 factor [Filimonas zeae]
MNNQLTDKDLWNRVRSENDASAFTELYNRYWKILLEIAWRKTRNWDDAQDIMQDVFVSLWKSRHRIEIQSTTIKNYLGTAIRYMIYARLKEGRKITWVEDITVIDAPHTSADCPEAVYDYRTLLKNVTAAQNELPHKGQLIFKLHREEGLKIKEIASALEISPLTVKTHLQRAIASLRKNIQPLLLFIFPFF